MQSTTTIRLPRGIEPTFPNRCVLSDLPDPDTRVSIIANQYMLWSAGPVALIRGWTRIRAPIRRAYKLHFYLQAFGREVLLAVGVIIGTAIGFWMMVAVTADSAGPTERSIAGTAGGLMGCIPAIWFARSHPPRFDVSIGRDWIDYIFSSADYGEEFARLNQAHVIPTDGN